MVAFQTGVFCPAPEVCWLDRTGLVLRYFYLVITYLLMNIFTLNHYLIILGGTKGVSEVWHCPGRLQGHIR